MSDSLEDTLKAIDNAEKQGIFSGAQAANLRAAARSGKITSPDIEPAKPAKPATPEPERPTQQPAPENPQDLEQNIKFQGFNDVLIAIGCAIFLFGALFFGIYAPAILAIGLGFWLINIRKLGLTSIVLTFGFATTVFLVAVFQISHIYGVNFIGPAIILSLFAWFALFRTPFTLFLIGGAFVAWIPAQYSGFRFETITGLTPETFAATLEAHALQLRAITLTIGSILFAVAVWLDTRDPMRKTNIADYAFWLHLVAAITLVTALSEAISVLTGDLAPILLVVMMLIFAMIGLILDRRSFITAGLFTLVGALSTLFIPETNTPETHFFNELSRIALVPFLIGGYAILIGLFWDKVRAYVILALPQGWRDNLPPAKA